MRTDRLACAYDIRLRLVHFPLHPETPPEGRSLAALFGVRGDALQEMSKRLARLMQGEGLPYGERTHTYNSRLAQELAAWAESQPGGTAIHDALFRAYFVDNVNLAVVDNLVDVAAGIDLEPDAARRVLTSRTHRSAVDADWERSARYGVTAVPTYICSGRAVVGAQPYEALEALVQAAGAHRR